jgi:hypothetical protein
MSFDSNKNLLFACGYSHKIYVYDPYIEFPVYQLKGHAGSINGVITNEKDSELISLDICGNIKLWDLNTLSCFQTFNINEKTQKNVNIKMVFLKKQKKIMVYCGNTIAFYESDKSLKPEVADDNIVFACFYDKIAKHLISFCLKKIKMWNPFTGKVKKIYDDPMGNEITAFTIDRNYKRSFLGDNTGKIKCFNMKNGKYLKDLEKHKAEINMLVHSLYLNIVVSCSVDGVIKIHDDAELMDSSVLKQLDNFPYQIKYVTIIDHSHRLAIGFSSGAIKFYDIEHLKIDSDVHNEIKPVPEVTCIYVVRYHDLIFSAHIDGTVRLSITPPGNRKFTVVHEMMNVTKHGLNTPVYCFDIDYKKGRLFLGDGSGCISCYYIKEMFNVYPFNPDNYIKDASELKKVYEEFRKSQDDCNS